MRLADVGEGSGAPLRSSLDNWAEWPWLVQVLAAGMRVEEALMVLWIVPETLAASSERGR